MQPISLVIFSLLVLIIAPVSLPPFDPPACIRSGPTIDIAFVLKKEIVAFLENEHDCASYWLQNYSWDSSACSSFSYKDRSQLNDLNISNMFRVRLCNTSTSVVHGEFVPFEFGRNDFTLDDLVGILKGKKELGGRTLFRWDGSKMEVEFVQNSCIPRTIQIAGNDYQLSSCIDNSLISSEMMYLQFVTDITQMVNFGADLLLEIQDQTLVISKNRTNVEITAGSNIEEYIQIRHENKTIYRNKVIFDKDGKARVSVSPINDKENLIVTLEQVFKAEDGSDYSRNFAAISDHLYIEIDLDLIDHTTDVNEMISDKFLMFEFGQPANENSIKSISKPFRISMNSTFACTSTTCLNGGTCVLKDSGTAPTFRYGTAPTCTCLSNFFGPYCQYTNSTITPLCSALDINCLNLEFQKVNFTVSNDSIVIGNLAKVDIIVEKTDTLSQELQPQALNLASNVLLSVSNREFSEESSDVINSYMNSINNVLYRPSKALTNSQSVYNSSNKFIEGVENILKKAKPGTDYSIYNLKYKNLDVKTSFYGLRGDSKYINSSFLSISSAGSTGTFSSDVVSSYISQGNQLKLSFVVYKNSKFFNTDKQTSTDLNCSATEQISDNVVYMSGIPGVSGENLVQTTFSEQLYETNCSQPGVKRVITYKCVFWNETLREWYDYGCYYEKKNTDGIVTHTCNCNHTTNFALLMITDSYPFCDWCEKVLEIVSLVGIFLSILGLLITICYDMIIACLSRVKVNSDNMGGTSRAQFLFREYTSMSNQFLKVITTWCFSLLAMNAAYLAFAFFDFSETKASEMTTAKKNSCIAIAVILHYFLLSSFCFALSISIIQYFIFFKSFKIFKHIYVKAVAFSLVIPLIVITICLAINVDSYINSNQYCWLDTPYSIYAVIIPIAIIMVTNIAFFLVIIVNYMRTSRKRKKYLKAKEDLEKDFQRGIKKEIILILTCFLNSTLTWLFGFLVTIPGSADWIYIKFVYALIFCILNSTQGFQIFIVYIIISKSRTELLNKKLRLVISELKIKLKEDVKNQLQKKS